MSPDAIRHLSKADPVLRQLIRRVGKCTLEPEKDRSPFQSLVRAVAHQQLNGIAAETILRRFLGLFPGKPFPAPEDLGQVTDQQIRDAGFSRAKVAAIRDIAEKTLSGVVPNSRAIARMEDDSIVERLTECRGVGRWTVEMLLIFKLGRPDVLPSDDFGVRHGFMLTYGRSEMPRPKELLAHGECWRPYRTTASWYLWRAVDLARSEAARPARKAGRAEKK